MKMKFMASPFGAKHDILLVIIDDKPCNTVDSGIVSRDHGEGSVDESLAIIWIIGIFP